jgi:transcriptional regulator with XRE-family HTH domain
MSGNKYLGEFLRARRHKLDPVALGLSAARRRRTQGLRREEVAERAGISSEWYVKLEQGRDVTPSAATVEALGRALMLDEVELAHLRSLAFAAGRQPFRREVAPEVLCRIVASLPEPAYLSGQRLDVLCLNDAAARLFGNFGLLASDERNIFRWMLTDPVARQVFGSTWEAEAQRILTLFRAEHDLRPGDAAFVGLVDHVRAGCELFEVWWSEHGIGAPLSGIKALHHPDLGIMQYEYASFQANDYPAIKLAIYTRR